MEPHATPVTKDNGIEEGSAAVAVGARPHFAMDDAPAESTPASGLARHRVKALSYTSEGCRDSGYCADSPSSVSNSTQPVIFFMEDNGRNERVASASSSASQTPQGAGSRGANSASVHPDDDGSVITSDDDDDETFYDAGNVTPAPTAYPSTPPVPIPARQQVDEAATTPSGQGWRWTLPPTIHQRLPAGAVITSGLHYLSICQPHTPRSCPTRFFTPPTVAAAAVLRNVSTQTPSPSSQALVLGRNRGGSLSYRAARDRPQSEGSGSDGADGFADGVVPRHWNLPLPDLLQHSFASFPAASHAMRSVTSRRQRAFSESSVSQVVISEVGSELRRISDDLEEEQSQRRLARTASGSGMPAAVNSESSPPEGGQIQGALSSGSRRRRSLLRSFKGLFGRDDDDDGKSSSCPLN